MQPIRHSIRAPAVALALALVLSGCAFIRTLAPPVPQSTEEAIELAFGTLTILNDAVADATRPPNALIDVALAKQIRDRLREAREYVLTAERHLANDEPIDADNVLRKGLDLINEVRSQLLARGVQARATGRERGDATWNT